MRLRGLAFLVEALELTAMEEVEQRSTEADVTLVSGENVFIWKTRVKEDLAR